jgi:hypothetical protein
VIDVLEHLKRGGRGDSVLQWTAQSSEPSRNSVDRAGEKYVPHWGQPTKSIVNRRYDRAESAHEYVRGWW